MRVFIMGYSEKKFGRYYYQKLFLITASLVK